MNTASSDSRCIFCEADADASASVEHIIPSHWAIRNMYFAPASVCDTCNNYFARKIEGPL